MSSTSTSEGNSGDSGDSGPEATDAPHRAGAFDIRNFIALLIGTYGVILVIAGLIGPSDAQLKKADGLNINLLAGIGMVVVAASFMLWARVRPVVVPEDGPGTQGAESSGRADDVHK